MCLTASHKNASFDLLERLSGGAETVGRRITGHSECVAGAVVISTCNRFEAYIDLDEPVTAGQQVGVEAATASISAASGIPADQLRETWSVHTDEEAARHLFAVSAGLESVIIDAPHFGPRTPRMPHTRRPGRSCGTRPERKIDRKRRTA